MKRFSFFLFSLIITNGLSAQVDNYQFRSNPIIFVEGVFGGAFGKSAGLSGGGSINYQFNKNLISARYIGVANLETGFVSAGFLAFPTVEAAYTLDEFSILYGRRFIEGGTSYSFSMGISHNRFIDYRKYIGNNPETSRYVGVPYELNIKWFNREKERYKIYGIFPVGRPIAFGSSFGFKLYGNFSKKTYLGVGLVFGAGTHKYY